jgi:hypothetical protein
VNNTKPNSTATFLEALIPGVSTLENLEATDTPSKIIEQVDKIIYTFPSTDSSRPHIVHVENGLITFIQIVVDETRPYSQEDVLTQYGEPEEKSFSTHSYDSPVYSYPQKGLSFVFDGKTNQTILIQKYVPTTKEVFNETVGKDFTTQQYGDVFPTPTTTVENSLGKPGNQPITTQKNISLYIVTAFVSLVIFTICILIFLKIKKRRQRIM